jgi:TonB family protein
MRNTLAITVAALTLLTPAPASAMGNAPACDVAAGVYGTPYLDVPGFITDYGLHGTVVVRVNLTSTGLLASEELYQSSGDVWLDRAGMDSARLTHFTPEMVGCRPVAGSYLYEVDF